MFTYRAAQHRITCFECIEHRALCNRTIELERNLAVTIRERLQVVRQYDPNHDSVWASTDNTAGRSRTIGSQLSPLSFDA